MGHHDVVGARASGGQLGDTHVRVGDDLVRIGDDCPLRAVAVVQIHLARYELSFVLGNGIASEVKVGEQSVHVTVVVEVKEEGLTAAPEGIG